MSSGDQLTPCSVCGRQGHWESSHAGDAEAAELLSFWLTKPSYQPVQGKDRWLFSSGNIILGVGNTPLASLKDAMNNHSGVNKAV